MALLGNLKNSRTLQVFLVGWGDELCNFNLFFLFGRQPDIARNLVSRRRLNPKQVNQRMRAVQNAPGACFGRRTRLRFLVRVKFAGLFNQQHVDPRYLLAAC